LGIQRTTKVTYKGIPQIRGSAIDSLYELANNAPLSVEVCAAPKVFLTKYQNLQTLKYAALPFHGGLGS
jgi:hypothetical protein